MDMYEFYNCGFFIFPLRVTQPDKLKSYLTAQDSWACVDAQFHTQYLLHYAPGVDSAQDDRLRIFQYTQAQELPLYLFGETIRERFKTRGINDEHEGSPALQTISLYLFGTDIAFLEFHLRYDGMGAREIAEFTFLFRSLRNNESTLEEFPEDKISPETAIGRILPQEQTGTVLCFHNLSRLKRQGNILTFLKTRPWKFDQEENEYYAYLLAHGYHTGFSDKAATDTPYEMSRRFGTDTFWGGSQDGLACVVEEPHSFQYRRLCCDYHALYLLLLNQRFASAAYIEAFARQDVGLQTANNLHDGVVSLKTRYAFRVISDDRHMQTIYSDMYRILELENLVQDLEDVNDQLSVLRHARRQEQEERRQERERKIGSLLGALSVFAIFSALIDFADFMDRFRRAVTLHSIISLVITASILLTAVIIILFWKGNKSDRT